MGGDRVEDVLYGHARQVGDVESDVDVCSIFTNNLQCCIYVRKEKSTDLRVLFKYCIIVHAGKFNRSIFCI